MYIHVCIQYIYLREIIIVSPVQRYLCNRFFLISGHYIWRVLELNCADMKNINGAILFKANC